MGIIDDKWELIFEKYKIKREIERNGLFYITAESIREFKEPRLMTKFDTRESLPSVFGKNLGILPVTRGKYVIGEFDLYKDFPECKSAIKHMTNVVIPSYLETINVKDIRSETGAINVMAITKMLDDFLGESAMLQTVSGRMGSGVFDFTVNKRAGHSKQAINVQNSQLEIDGGFENEQVFAIIEGKNVVHSNFLIRQLYYPYRLWQSKIGKTIRPVFMVYSNNIFRLLEYEFGELTDYNSLQLVQEKNYSLEDIEITREELRIVYHQTKVKPEPAVPFVQADSFEKIISLVEKLNEMPLSTLEIAARFGFKERQSDYYFNACKYLGLACKQNDEDGLMKVFITDEGRNLLKKSYKIRQLEYVKRILEHRIFNEIFAVAFRCGEIPDKKFIIKKMAECNVNCGEKLWERRASSAIGWINWIFRLAVD